MSEAFTASVRALELPDDAALVKPMGRGELEARVREYARAEAVAPPDVEADIKQTNAARERYMDQMKEAAAAGDPQGARDAEVLAQIMTDERERLQVAGAARREWAETTASKGAAARQARAELDARGPARWDERRPEAQVPEVPQVLAVDPAEAARWRSAQAELASLTRLENRVFLRPEADREALPDKLGTWMEQRLSQIEQDGAEAGRWPEAQSR